MEPTILNSPLPDDDQLAAWYRANASDAPLPDDGFSRGVLVALPRPRKSVAAQRRLFVLVGALLGTAVVYFKVSTSGQSSSDLPEFTSNISEAFALPASAVFALAFGIAAISLWYVLRPKLHLLPRF